MKWTVHGEQTIYDSDWVRLTLADIEVPGVARHPHHVVRMPSYAAGTLVHDRARGVLLLWRHRFITDAWGWEIPAGRIDAGESPVEAAARETLEESGWQPGGLTSLVTYNPSNGISDQRHHLFLADGATHVGEPADPSESERIEWVPVDRLHHIVAAGEMPDGLSLVAVLYALAFGHI